MDQSLNGKIGGYADAGAFIFCVIVMVAQVKVLVSVYTIGCGIITVTILSIAAYAGVQILVSADPNYDQFGTGEVVASLPIMYFAMFFFVVTFGLLDAGLNNIRKFIKMRRMMAQEAEEFEKKQREAKDPRNVRHR